MDLLAGASDYEVGSGRLSKLLEKISCHELV